MIKTDFHAHSYFSTDSKVPTEKQIEKAISLGLNTICMTEHNDMDCPLDNNGKVIFQLDTDNYFKEMLRLRAKYSGQIDIRIGVELGMQKQLTNEMTEYVNKYPFDFVLGSSHRTNSNRDPFLKSYFEGRSEHEAFLEYFTTIMENAKEIDNFDAYAHIDYVVRYAQNPKQAYDVYRYMDIFEQTFKSLISKGKGIEVNTGGWHRGLTHAHPHIELLKLYKSLGGEILTVGSDDHITEYLGYRFDDVSQLLEQVGFKYYTVFKERKPEFLHV